MKNTKCGNLATRLVTATLGLLLAHPAVALIPGESAVLGASDSVANNWQTVDLPQSFSNPVVLLGPPSFNGSDPGVLRVRDITANSFQMKFQEWEYLDKWHTTENVPYLVLDAGRYTLGDGSVWEVGSFSLDKTTVWSAQSFSQAFAGTPRVFLTIQTFNGNQPLTVRAREVTPAGFEAAFFEEQGRMDGHVPELVGYVAVYNPTGAGNAAIGGATSAYELGSETFNNDFSAALGGPAELKLEEEQSLDLERWHADEQVDLLNLAGRLFAQTVSFDGADTIALRRMGNPISNPLVCPDPVTAPNVSINSTAQISNCQNLDVVPEVAEVANNSYSVLAINDLGMHCGDLDTRISSILPPFQVLLAQVIQKGGTPILNPAGVSLEYSAASNPNDPILDGVQAFPGVMADGSTYKTNFWDVIANGVYDAFYPPVVTPLLTGPFPVTEDIGLPVPNAEELYIGHDGVVDSGDEALTAVQHAMPGLTDPYMINTPQAVEEHYGDKPFFINFPFGYVAEQVNWYEGAGIPFAAYDDFGRENAYPLVRVEAKQGNTTVATVDTVLPISGEASCTNCHSDPTDVQNSRTSQPTNTLINAGLPVATSLDDPDDNMPMDVSVEYAADINILRLHDLKHGANYVDTTGGSAPCDVTANGGNGNANCLINQALEQDKAVVCQVCHYTPALDLAQVGPMAGPPGSDANGRNQVAHSSNSNVMHSHHGQFTSLFPDMPAPNQLADGTITNQNARLDVLEDTCYQCHPGTNVQCLRGAMFNGGMLCNDCHGDMEQVGNDFSAGVSPQNPGAFVLDQGNFYDPNSNQPRVPWANEPGCGSCHTGDANNNLTGMANTLVNTADTNGNDDGIRLRVAYRTDDAKATPIVPTNKRFAEPAVPASFNGFANPGAGNPQLYRVSTGHGGVMCEGCHGATHAEWPNANPNANDNVTANQLQGHTGTISECGTCHNTGQLSSSTQGGPHGMHLVNDSRWYNEAHKDAAKQQNGQPGRGTCGACHGSDHRGTVLSRVPVTRTLRGHTVQAGEPIGCDLCHSLSKSFEN